MPAPALPRTAAATVASKAARASKLREEALNKTPEERTPIERATVDPADFRDELRRLYDTEGAETRVAEKLQISRGSLRHLLRLIEERGFGLELDCRRGVGSRTKTPAGK